MKSLTRTVAIAIATALVLAGAGAALASEIDSSVGDPSGFRPAARADYDTPPAEPVETLRAGARAALRKPPRKPERPDQAPSPRAALHGIEEVDGVLPRLTRWPRWQRLTPAGRRAARRPDTVFPVEAAPDYGSSGARFGAPRSGHMHEGQDLFAPAGTPLVAASDGVVLETGSDGGRGNFVAMYGPARDETFVYLHMLAPAEVTVGERVEAGQRVGEVGCTGTCFGDHLHFEVRQGSGSAGPAEDPLPLLQELDG